MTDAMKSAGACFRHHRKMKGLSVRAVAKAVECSASSVSMIERGALRPDTELAMLLLNAINAPLLVRSRIVNGWSERERLARANAPAGRRPRASSRSSTR